jgi:xanthine dehydrogenase FAD-binding subunit
VKDFAYFAPKTVSEATALLTQHGPQAKVLAGGTDIIVQLREGLRQAEVVIDIKHIPDLTHFSLNATGLQIGAAVPCYKLYENAAIKQAYAALTDAAHIIGGWQIQSRASIGGNLCNSSPAADSIPALIALNATANISGQSGQRTVAIKGFCTAPGKNILQSGEMLVSLTVPATSPKSGSAYERFIPRNEMDIAVVGAASWVQLNAQGTEITACRIALGAVAPTPKLAELASQSLLGKAPSEAVFEQAGELAKQVASPISDIRGTKEYRLHLVGVLVKRTLQTAVARAMA